MCLVIIFWKSEKRLGTSWAGSVFGFGCPVLSGLWSGVSRPIFAVQIFCMPHTQKINAAITAVGGYVPETKLTNFDLEKMVDTNDEWIRTRTGVEERRILKEPGKASSDLAVPAVLQICEKRGISPEEIDCIICATVTPDMVFPATANIISDKVGAKNAWGFDLGAACSGFLYALTTGAALIESRRYKKIVVIGVD